jgi:hypothetical protein
MTSVFTTLIICTAVVALYYIQCKYGGPKK